MSTETTQVTATVETTRRLVAEWSIGGRFFPEYKHTHPTDRTIGGALPHARAYAVRFYTEFRQTVRVPGLPLMERVTREDESPTHYIGEVFTLPEVEAMGAEMATLVANMRGNEWSRVVRCHCGNWQPVEGDDVVVPRSAFAQESA